MERLGIERSRRALADAALVLVVVDGTVGLHTDDLAVMAALEGRASLVAWNKSDLQPLDEVSRAPKYGIGVVATSAITGAGLDELRGAILELATGGSAAETGMLTSLRHHQAVRTAIGALEDGATALSASIPHEMVLLDLYRALWALDGLTGQTTPDDVLNLIFSRFCIGK
uniref:tRNA modification GTPase TrmE n=1 Tax=mine drainage metagenome TaxID=410659 RepID=E6PXF9_9ZZZZ